VQEERLIDLPKDVLRELSSKGYLRAIYAHLNSLQNWEKLIKRCIT
ncbi:MAG: SapC family protein, partial [Hydrogenobacter thermophilus]|nr:SapC family protein [Hydrogenobacter thermophilus]